MQLPLFGQDSIPFTINFPVFPGGPSGSAELVGSSFTAQTTPWNLAPDSGLIFEMAGDGSTTSMFQFSSFLTGEYPPIPEFPSSGPEFPDGGGTFYYYYETWNLSPPQAESLLAGHWFMEIAFGSSTLLSQITPVPEPTSAALLTLGAAVVRFCWRRRLRECEHDANKRKYAR